VKDGALTGTKRGYSLMDVTVLPEGIEVIGKDAMRGFECAMLVMPRTLKRIQESAFENACIDDIDFGDCKLEVIEDNAFCNCEVKAALPDSVRSIGWGGVYGLEINCGKRLRLPGSLRYLGDYALCLKGIEDIEVDAGLVRAQSNLAHSILGSLECGQWALVHVCRWNKEKYGFVLYQDEKHGCVWGETVWPFIGDKGFDFRKYDWHIWSMHDKSCYPGMVANRLFWHARLDSRSKAEYTRST
jgi:hypothetical protein